MKKSLFFLALIASFVQAEDNLSDGSHFGITTGVSLNFQRNPDVKKIYQGALPVQDHVAPPVDVVFTNSYVNKNKGKFGGNFGFLYFYKVPCGNGFRLGAEVNIAFGEQKLEKVLGTQYEAARFRVTNEAIAPRANRDYQMGSSFQSKKLFDSSFSAILGFDMPGVYAYLKTGLVLSRFKNTLSSMYHAGAIAAGGAQAPAVDAIDRALSQTKKTSRLGFRIGCGLDAFVLKNMAVGISYDVTFSKRGNQKDIEKALQFAMLNGAIPFADPAQKIAKKLNRYVSHSIGLNIKYLF